MTAGQLAGDDDLVAGHGSVDEAGLAATRDQVVRRDRDDSTVSQFTVAADGVCTIDSSSLSLEEVVTAVLALVEERTGRRPDPVHA
jgi:cytidylate kinase